MAVDHKLPQVTSSRAWKDLWHLWTVLIPRRSIAGRLVFGKVWRRHDGRRWIYKKFIQDNAEWEYRRSAGILVKESRK